MYFHKITLRVYPFLKVSFLSDLINYYYYELICSFRFKLLEGIDQFDHRREARSVNGFGARSEEVMTSIGGANEPSVNHSKFCIKVQK